MMCRSLIRLAHCSVLQFRFDIAEEKMLDVEQHIGNLEDPIMACPAYGDVCVSCGLKKLCSKRITRSSMNWQCKPGPKA